MEGAAPSAPVRARLAALQWWRAMQAAQREAGQVGQGVRGSTAAQGAQRNASQSVQTPLLLLLLLLLLPPPAPAPPTALQAAQRVVRHTAHVLKASGRHCQQL